MLVQFTLHGVVRALQHRVQITRLFTRGSDSASASTSAVQCFSSAANSSLRYFSASKYHNATAVILISYGNPSLTISRIACAANCRLRTRPVIGCKMSSAIKRSTVRVAERCVTDRIRCTCGNVMIGVLNNSSARRKSKADDRAPVSRVRLSLIHISEPTRPY